jgi:hypothetical protein
MGKQLRAAHVNPDRFDFESLPDRFRQHAARVMLCEEWGLKFNAEKAAAFGMTASQWAQRTSEVRRYLRDVASVE